MSKFENSVKRVNGLVEAYGKSVKDHTKAFTDALVASVSFMAITGQNDPLNRMYALANGPDKEGMRIYLKNLIEGHGYKVIGDDGKERRVPFFSFSATDKVFKIAKSENAKKTREIIAEMPESELAKISIGKPDRVAADDMANTFDEMQVIKNTIKRLARNGAKASALAINRALNNPMTAGEIDEIAKSGDPVAKRDKLLAEAAKLDAAIQKRNANGIQGETTLVKADDVAKKTAKDKEKHPEPAE